MEIPFLTPPTVATFVAALRAVFFLYAVGGACLLARECRRARRDSDANYGGFWRKCAVAFVPKALFLAALAEIAGESVAWLTAPTAADATLQIFFFGRAIALSLFSIELVAGLAFCYFWEKLSTRTHLAIGWLYAFAAWGALVFVTADRAFALNSKGLLADWEITGGFWDAFLNLQLVPQTVAQTGAAILLGTFYVLMRAARFEPNMLVRERVARRMRTPALFGLLLTLGGLVASAFFLPASALVGLERSAAANFSIVVLLGIAAIITFVLFVGPFARPGETSVAAAVGLFALTSAGIATGEFLGSAVRRPYAVDSQVYAHQIYRADLPRLRQTGLLYNGVWTRLYLDKIQEKYPELNISAEKYLGWQPVKPAYWEKLEELR
ncbi:MAG: hypothetical protein HUK22_07040, partial [Thermoguttaceae bacterium]|nr:hypothetical protein [Thermoguttaceae bacterium]